VASRQEVFRAMMSEKKCVVPKRSLFGCSDGGRRPHTRGASAAVRRKGMRAPSRGVGAPDAGFLPSDSGPRGAAVRLLCRRPAAKGRCGGGLGALPADLPCCGGWCAGLCAEAALEGKGQGQGEGYACAQGTGPGRRQRARKRTRSTTRRGEHIPEKQLSTREILRALHTSGALHY